MSYNYVIRGHISTISWVHRIKFWVQPLENNPLSLFTLNYLPPLVSRRKEMSKISFYTPLHESSEAFTIAQIRIYTVEPHGFSRAKTSHTQVTIKAVSNTVMYYSFEIWLLEIKKFPQTILAWIFIIYFGDGAAGGWKKLSSVTKCPPWEANPPWFSSWMATWR